MTCLHGHPSTRENVGSRKDGSRYCRACSKLRAQRRRARKRDEVTAELAARPIRFKYAQHISKNWDSCPPDCPACARERDDIARRMKEAPEYDARTLRKAPIGRQEPRSPHRRQLASEDRYRLALGRNG